jgi:hypothetical protein
VTDSLRAPTEGMIDALQSYAVCAGNIDVALGSDAI